MRASSRPSPAACTVVALACFCVAPPEPARAQPLPAAPSPPVATASPTTASPTTTPPPLIEKPARRSPIRVNLAVTLPVIISSGLVGLGAELVKGELGGPYCGLSCSIDSLNALDRRVVGNHSDLALKLSDGLVASSIALPFVADLIDTLISGAAARSPSGQRLPGWQKDALKSYGEGALVLLETFAINIGTIGIIKLAVRRPRPLVYDPSLSDAERLDPDAALSFYSSHSSTAFAMATAYSTLLTLRHPDRPGLLVPVWLLSEGLALATALLRVEAGKHFYTDILTGAVVGAALGVAVPMLHRRAAQLRIDGQAVRFSPLLFSGGGGLALISTTR